MPPRGDIELSMRARIAPVRGVLRFKIETIEPRAADQLKILRDFDLILNIDRTATSRIIKREC
jgi:hypothetical protein